MRHSDRYRLARLARMASQQQDQARPRVGIALSGGIVRGFVHLGVLQVLEEAGIAIDVVGGSSVGALIGYCYAAGMSLDQIDHFSADLSWSRMARPVFPREGLVSFDGLEGWLVETLGDLHFADLARPFVVSTTDLESGEPVGFTSGPVAPAVRASCSVPGFVSPTHFEGRVLGDGGISKNTPAQAVRELGADYVIGVDVFYPTLRRRLGPLGPGLAAIEIMVQRSGSGREEADCLITPCLEGVTWVDFGQRGELIDYGREAAAAKIDEIRTELRALTAS